MKRVYIVTEKDNNYKEQHEYDAYTRHETEIQGVFETKELALKEINKTKRQFSKSAKEGYPWLDILFVWETGFHTESYDYDIRENCLYSK
jgi:hypothetical protein